MDNPDVIYARCDVGGVFKTTDRGRHWQTCNSGLSRWYNHSVQSIAVDPQNHNIVFRCSGDTRNKTLYGSIHRSCDGGKTWKEVCSRVGFYGNGGTRMFGELIAIDPFNGKNVFAAGYSGGIWVSTDSGFNWTYKLGSGERFGTVGVNPWFKNIYYAGTLSGKLYRSVDNGNTWTMVFQTELKDFGFTEFAFDKKNKDILYAACKGAGIYRSTDGGKSFSQIMNGLPQASYNTIAADPSNTSVLYTAPDARPNHSMAPVPVYVSKNAGKSWELIKNHTWNELKKYPSYMRSPVYVGWAISKVRVDNSNPGNLILSNWYGVSFSYNHGKSWTGYQFSGLETNCLEHIAVGPSSGEVFYMVADHMPMHSRDGGKTYHMLPRSSMTSSTALLKSAFDSAYIIFGARSKGNAGIFRLKGDTTELIKSFEKAFIQALKEDPFQPGTIYACVDGDLTENAGLYKTTDWGKRWQKLPLSLPAHLKTLPHNALFIENELLNIVIGQRKNVCSANQLLCMDPLQEHVFYMGEWTEGIFKTSDGGQTWNNISGNLPFHRDTASVLTVVKADKNRKGWIYAGFLREGLWRTKDGGQNWEKVYPLDSSVFNVNSVHIGGINGNEIYIAGENLYWANCAVHVTYSGDNGCTWQNIYDTSLGALRIKGIDVDPVNGDIILATSGNGAFYAKRGERKE